MTQCSLQYVDSRHKLYASIDTFLAAHGLLSQPHNAMSHDFGAKMQTRIKQNRILAKQNGKQCTLLRILSFSVSLYRLILIYGELVPRPAGSAETLLTTAILHCIEGGVLIGIQCKIRS